jgi:hypothetical protein
VGGFLEAEVAKHGLQGGKVLGCLLLGAGHSRKIVDVNDDV